jgi:hypoxanthine phosphoribosyltransferase
MENIKILDKEFKPYLSAAEIQTKISVIASKLNKQLDGKDPLFMGILNGSFMFASDLYKQITVPSQITFLKLASYQGTGSTGKVKRLIGINEDIKDKIVVIIEDIVDTGVTLDSIIKQLRGYEPKEIIVVTLMFKPEAYTKEFKVDYYAFDIPNDFIVGYGLDYDGYGRNLADIYVIKE